MIVFINLILSNNSTNPKILLEEIIYAKTWVDQ